MAQLKDVCHYIRSKNAGPFWLTVDLFFHERSYEAYSHSPGLEPGPLALAACVEPDQVRIFRIPSLHVVKITYPRSWPQGGALERDLHGGQQFVAFRNLEV